MGQSATFAPGTGPYSERPLKSCRQNRGVLASQWTVPPPTVVGRSLTSPTNDLATPCRASSWLRAVLGSRTGSWFSNDLPALTSSLPNSEPRPSFVPSPGRRLRPFSRTTTSNPAAVRAHAATLPPAPDPTTMADATAQPFLRPG